MEDANFFVFLKVNTTNVHSLSSKGIKGLNINVETCPAFDIINTRADLLQTLDDIYTTSKDSYVTIRSMIFQKQKKLEDRIKKG